MSQKSFLISIVLVTILSLGLPQPTRAQDPEATGSDPLRSSSTVESDDISDEKKRRGKRPNITLPAIDSIEIEEVIVTG